ncbi:MAG: bifunctional methylenetetrahydrofolate dehydrogenase/methenyltetrahydrofolate cyclohydrolase FolD [Ruminococcus sp.]|nr:bifunctional methylenetetrahydrofolate dehydrogenase/methenyltetrahydrofolate cyclohydrolase FolD [Ruminococcus sp.]
MAQIISGKDVSARVKADVAAETAQLGDEKGLKVGLAVVIVGNDPASRVYVNNKKKACEEVGFKSFEYALDESTTEEQLLDLIDVLNRDSRVNGILVQLPLPKHINETAVINAISPERDVDAFHPVNVGKIMIGEYSFLPCTPAGVMELIASTGTEISGKSCVVIGRSNIVGKPMAMLLLHKSGTVTICHSKTRNLKEICLGADILVVAVGKANFVTGDMIKEGAVVIDVGMNRLENGKLCGDVEFESAEKKASYITPVPGGVGPMTISMLMRNTLTAAKHQAGIE